MGCASPSFAGVRLLPKKCKNDECVRDSPGSDNDIDVVVVVVGVIDTNDGAVGLVDTDSPLSTDAIESRFVDRWLCRNASYRSYASSSLSEWFGDSPSGSGGSSLSGDVGTFGDRSGTAGAGRLRRLRVRAGRGGGGRDSVLMMRPAASSTL